MAAKPETNAVNAAWPLPRAYHHRGDVAAGLRPNDGGVAKRYGVVLAGGGAGDGTDACVIFFFA